MEAHRISLEEGATPVYLLFLVAPRCVQTVTQCLTLLRGWDRDKVFLFNSPRILQRGGRIKKEHGEPIEGEDREESNKVESLSQDRDDRTYR